MQLSVSTKGNGRHTLVFLHQACGGARFWECQVNDPLFEKYTRICIDLPGHGGSPASRRPAEEYSLPALGGILGNALQQLQLEEYILVTMSIGGSIAAEALPKLNGCKGLFIAGGCLLGGAVTPAMLLLPFEYGMVLFEAHPPEEQLQRYVAGLVSEQHREVLHRLVADYRHTDPAFREQLAASLGRGVWNNQIAQVSDAGIPSAFVYGEYDRIIDHSYLDSILPGKWRGRPQVLPAAGHLASLDQPDAFNRLLDEFVREIW